MAESTKHIEPKPRQESQSLFSKIRRRLIGGGAAVATAALLPKDTNESIPREPIERKGGIAIIRRKEGTYYLMYGNHIEERDPKKFPGNLTAVVFEGSAGDEWTRVSQLEIDLHEGEVKRNQEQDKQPRRPLNPANPYHAEILRLREENEKRTRELAQRYVKPSAIDTMYKNRTEYSKIIRTIESQQLPVFFADVEFKDKIFEAAPYLSVLDDQLTDFLNMTADKFPGTIPTLQVVYDSYTSAWRRESPFPAMTHPIIASVAEGVIGSSMLAKMTWERLKTKKLSRRDFLTGSEIAKGAFAGWLTLPVIESTLFATKGIQGEFLHPEMRKLIETTHPEVWFLILTLRNVLLAHKEHWLLTHKDRWLRNQETAVTNLGTIIGSAHTGLEDQILHSPEERMKLLKAVKPLLKIVYNKESVYKMLKYDFDGKQWRTTGFYEVPELKALVTED